MQHFTFVSEISTATIWDELLQNKGINSLRFIVSFKPCLCNTQFIRPTRLKWVYPALALVARAPIKLGPGTNFSRAVPISWVWWKRGFNSLVFPSHHFVFIFLFSPMPKCSFATFARNDKQSWIPKQLSQLLKLYLDNHCSSWISYCTALY